MREQKDRAWVSCINSRILDLYPIQFANCDRLWANKAVYIFDEVGSGKTISSGLMALDYLMDHPKGDVCVITTNTLAKAGVSSAYGQFLTDWLDKLPFYNLGLTGRVTVINNHYRRIREIKSCGLLIIDEAHLFLNPESLRSQSLCGIRADKVVFLTATPIKSSDDDLAVYHSYAEKITGEEPDASWIGTINTEGKTKRTIICSNFDPQFPVTRYFKDTIMSLNKKGFEKKQAKRLIPEIWRYDWKRGKDQELLERLNACYAEAPESRFVIFTRLVEAEAFALGEFLRENGFQAFDADKDCGEKSVKVITGENSYELAAFSGHDHLPTVLIITCQIAEQGVNLPGFNYVINYSISAFPSSLEQRFGRIDRMGRNGSLFPEIHMCFLLCQNLGDTDTENFNRAVSFYFHSLLTHLPSKNTILSEDAVKYFLDHRENIDNYVKRLKELVAKDTQIAYLVEYFEKTVEDMSQSSCKCDKSLFHFIRDHKIEFDLENKDRQGAICQFRKNIFQELEEYGDILKHGKLTEDQLIEIIRSIGDKVYYRSGNELHTVYAAEECAGFIDQSPSFQQYKAEFLETIRLPLTIEKYREQLNAAFENKFIENDFSILFPYIGYGRIVAEMLEGEPEISEEERKLLTDHADDVVLSLPFFGMCQIFKELLREHLRYGNTSYHYNPFLTAFYELFWKVRQSETHFGLSEHFFKTYFAEYRSGKGQEYYTIKKDENNILQASNWYKLAYHYTRKEELFTDTYDWYSGEANVFCRKEKLVKYLIANYEAYQKAYGLWNEECSEYHSACNTAMDGEDASFDPQEMLAEMGFYGEPEQPEIIADYENKLAELKVIMQYIAEPAEVNRISLFSYYSFTEKGYLRKYAFGKPELGNGRVFCRDIWTQGIIYELYGLRYEGGTIGEQYPTPEFLKEVYVCY